MARYKIDEFVRVLVYDSNENIQDTFRFDCLSDAVEFMRDYQISDDSWSHEFVYQRGNSLESLVEESISEDGEYYENGVNVSKKLLR